MKTKSLFPWERNGSHYFTDETGRRVFTGAMIGRPNLIPADSADFRGKLHLRKVPLIDYGCYDKGGAYWGQGSSALYCAFGETETEQIEFYTRAKSREEAKEIVRKTFVNAGFCR